MSADMTKEFIKGRPYLLVHFLDEKFIFPTITSLVYLGKNLEGSGKDDLWFFRDAGSYLQHGGYDGAGTKAPRGKSAVGQVYDFPESQLRNVFTVEELIEELRRNTAD